MSNVAEKRLSLREAAAIIFRTSEPNSQQLTRTYELMKRGTIRVVSRGKSPYQWVTTDQILAELMAANSLQSLLKADRDGKAANEVFQRAALRDSADNLQNVYRSVWKDYFLAVILRRQVSRRTSNFQRAVVIGQVAFLLLVVGTTIGVARAVLFSKRPEHAAIERYLAEQTEKFTVHTWYPAVPAADGNGVIVRAQYVYFQGSNRPIHTDRKFRVVGDTASEFVEPDDT